MKSSIILAASAWALNAAIFAALAMPATEKATDKNFIPTGYMLPEVIISSLPTFELPEIIVRSTTDGDSMPKCTLPEVTIVAKAKIRA